MEVKVSNEIILAGIIALVLMALFKPHRKRVKVQPEYNGETGTTHTPGKPHVVPAPKPANRKTGSQG